MPQPPEDRARSGLPPGPRSGLRPSLRRHPGPDPGVPSPAGSRGRAGSLASTGIPGSTGILARTGRRAALLAAAGWALAAGGVAAAPGASPLAATPGPGDAAEAAPDLLLVLAVDASGSVSAERFALQRQGYAAAFRDPAVLRAIAATATGAVGVCMTQWTGPALQADVLDWTLLGSDAAALRFADAVDGVQRRLFGGGTSISGAIDHAMALLARAPWPAPRRVIDVSGDGANNAGRPPAAARDAAVAAGAVINGLPILAVEPGLDEHYRAEVIGGPGAFLVAAQDFADFARAIRQKLVTEIAVPAAPGAAPPGRARPA